MRMPMLKSSTKFFLVAGALLTISSTAARAAECRSVGGHLNQRPVSVQRQVAIKDGILTLKGAFEGKNSPMRRLPCVALASGVMCEASFGPVIVTVMTNGARMIETVADANTRKEEAGIAYECDRPVMLR